MSTSTTTIELTLNPARAAKDVEVIREGDDRHDVASTQNVVAERSNTAVERKGTTVVIITTVAGATIISSMLAGIVTIALPVMAKDLEIPEALLFW